MNSEKMYFGYAEEEILKTFRESKDQVDINSKIGDGTTLSQLVESSGRLLRENADFLHMIYNDLDD